MKLIKILILLFLFQLLTPETFAKKGFEHRGYLGWMIDFSKTQCLDSWPSIKLDSAMLADYQETLDFLQTSGMNEITIWGLFTNKYWEPEIERTIDSNRKVLIDKVILMAHQRNIKVILGMGVYSWGFDKILELHPELRCACNPHVLDLSNPGSWAWQKKVFDYTLDNFDFDGISMQSADLGRCNCGESSKMNDLEYHAIVNQMAVKYIRSRKPSFIIGISGWGMDFGNTENLKFIVKMTQGVDYLIDVEDTSLKAGRGYRKRLIKAIAPCAFGSTAVPNVEPIQRLPRTAYFVPTLFHTGRLLKNLYADGGLACEAYARTRGNPGDLVTGEVIALILANPEVDVQVALSEVLQKLYKPINKDALDELIKIYSVAEDAFFSNYQKRDKNFDFKDIILLVPRDGTGIENSYLDNMVTSSRMNYKNVIEALTICVSDLENKVQNKKELRKLGQCFEQVFKLYSHSVNIDSQK